MKKLVHVFISFVTLFFLLGVVAHAQTSAVNQWGTTPRGTANWPVLNTASTTDGSASMGANAKPTGWTSIKGGFATVTPTTSQAFVISGTFEFVGGGGGNGYTWLRYALFNGDGVLSDRNTTAAKWSEVGTMNGYGFTPVSGTGTISNTYRTFPQGNQGTQWYLLNSTGWNSTNGAEGGPISVIRQQPNRQVATAGVYDWAISVQPLADGKNEVRWYFIQQHAAGSQNYYWWGGSFIDPTPVTKKFNSIGFAVNSDVDDGLKEVRLTNVKAGLGSPITVPAAPWQAFYVDQWGSTPRGSAWPILNDETYLVGNAAMGSTAKPSGWTSIKGGFNPVTLVEGKAMTITGTFEFVGGGGGSGYTWLRYALFHGEGDLTDQNKPTAKWSEVGTMNGYGFTPVSGTGTISNTYRTFPQGNQGTEWFLLNSTAWNSTNGAEGGPISVVRQQPARQVATAGVYDFAISVQPLANGSNQVTWYFIQKHDANSQNYYWWGGTFNDPTPVTKKFNSIGFAVNNDVDDGLKQVNIKDVKIDMGPAITVPTPPWQAYYLSDWGYYQNKTGGWTITPGEVIGNVTTGGTKPATVEMSVLRGGFVDPVTPTTTKALVVTGKMQFEGGGFDSWASLRYGVFYDPDAGTISSNKWSGSGAKNTGYLFMPRGGKTDIVYWPNIQKIGNWGGIVNGDWFYGNGTKDYILGNTNQIPSNAIAKEGTYDFGISIAPQADGTTEIRQFIQKDDKSYYWAGKTIDPTKPAPTSKYNSVIFGLGTTLSTTKMNLLDIKVDLGNPITIPADPTTSVEGVEEVPTEFALNQNYPNPFNPTTTIEFALPKDSDVKLVVYDVLGKVVAELVNGQFKAGNHKVNFNGNNLSSGIYFYSINAGEFSSVRKLMLLK